MNENYINTKAALQLMYLAETEAEQDFLCHIIHDSFETYENTLNRHNVIAAYLIHDNIYFTKEKAELFEDGKDKATVQYIILQPNEVITEGACYHHLFDTSTDAYTTILEELLEDRNQ